MSSYSAKTIIAAGSLVLSLGFFGVSLFGQRSTKKPLPVTSSTSASSLVPPAGIDPAYYYKIGGQYPDLFEEKGHIFSIIIEPYLMNASMQRPALELLRITDLSNALSGASFTPFEAESGNISGIKVSTSYQQRENEWYIDIDFPKSKHRASFSILELEEWQVQDTRLDTFCGTKYLTRTAPVKFQNAGMGASILFWSPKSYDLDWRELITALGPNVAKNLLDPAFVFVTQDTVGHQLNAWKRLGSTRCGLYWDAGRQLFLARAG